MYEKSQIRYNICALQPSCRTQKKEDDHSLRRIHARIYDHDA